MTVPFGDVHLENLSLLSKAIVAEIDALPQFPDNIVLLQKLLSDPETEIADIAAQISMDPSLTADLLKVVNSAQFMLPKSVGSRRLKNLLYSCRSMMVLDRGQKWLWDHSYKTAFYAYNLAKSFKKKDIFDDAYVGGILRDMGKIIFSNVHPELLEKINNFCERRGIGKSFVENLTAGLNHAEIGGMLAEKWNFPRSLLEAIKYHHSPTEHSPEFADVVNTVYLGIADQEQLDHIRQRLAAAFVKALSTTIQNRVKSLTEQKTEKDSMAQLFQVWHNENDSPNGEQHLRSKQVCDLATRRSLLRQRDFGTSDCHRAHSLRFTLHDGYLP